MATDPRQLCMNRTSNLSNRHSVNLQRARNIANTARGNQNTSSHRLAGLADGYNEMLNISKKVRTGVSSIDSLIDYTARQAIDTAIGGGPESLNDAAAERFVFDKLGINTALNDAVSELNPVLATTAKRTARELFGKMVRGELTERDAADSYATFSGVAQAGSLISYKPEYAGAIQSNCGASPYAMDLIAFAPKFKYLFVVQFEFEGGQAGYGALNDINHAFVVRTSTRPTVDFDYEEVNMYNFWTRVPKRTVYQPMTMRFYDDNMNQAMMMFNAYLRSMSPIANIDHNGTNVDLLSEMGMDFEGTSYAYPGPTNTARSSAGLGHLNQPDAKNILRNIKLFHVYREGRSMNVYNFSNPKIMQMEMDDLDMADGGTGNEISFQFAYDNVHISTGQNVNQALADISRGKGHMASQWHLHENASGTVHRDPNGGPSSEQTSPSNTPGTKRNVAQNGGAYVPDPSAAPNPFINQRVADQQAVNQVAPQQLSDVSSLIDGVLNKVSSTVDSAVEGLSSFFTA